MWRRTGAHRWAALNTGRTMPRVKSVTVGHNVGTISRRRRDMVVWWWERRFRHARDEMRTVPETAPDLGSWAASY